MNLKSLLFFFPLFFILQYFPENATCQSWDFIKEKDGIKIYTRKDKDSSLKSFMGIMDIHSPIEKVFNLIGNVKNVDWWDKNLREINVLLYEKDKHIQYYLVYGAPWPVTDRDLCVDAKITTDPVTGIRVVYSTPMLNVIPEKPDRVRITDYWQRWTIEPRMNGIVHLVLEGHVDPAGSVPDWIYNMVITETPLKIMRGIKRRLETP
ncbi:MAG: hypothetical protein PHF97_02840 [Bacteroidales bacterium]|nr:hypothetical protein [Bacteroidales bacterium]